MVAARRGIAPKKEAIVKLVGSSVEGYKPKGYNDDIDIDTISWWVATNGNKSPGLYMPSGDKSISIGICFGLLSCAAAESNGDKLVSSTYIFQCVT